MPVTIDGTSVSEITIDGTKVQEITMDGDVVWTAETLVDSYEDADIAEYQSDTASFSVTTNNAPKDGSYRLERSGDGYAQIESLSGLPAYPKAGDEFRAWCYTGDGTATSSYAAFIWAAQDSATFHYCRAKPQSDSFEMVLNGAGSTSTAVTLSLNTWYEYRIQWDDGATFGGSNGDFTAYLHDASGTQIASIGPINDTSLTGGGIGWGVAEAPAGGDYIRITNR